MIPRGLIAGLAAGAAYPIFGAVFYFGGYLLDSGIVRRSNILLVDGCVTTSPDGVVRVTMPVVTLLLVSIYIGRLGTQFTDAATAQQAAVQLFALIDRQSDCDPSGDGGFIPTVEPRGRIELRDVHFAYPTRPQHPVCRGWSLLVRGGERAALCGPSGGGKSTIVALLERFYEPATGHLTLDGVQLRHLNVRWLRAQIGLVGQEPVLFAGDVHTNIACPVPGGGSREDVIEAAKLAHAHGFITTVLQNGYATEVGARGERLSGGQKQRIAIARALVRKPKVLLLDEATSALDNESEREVQAAISELMTTQRITTITIAHRLSTIRDSDVIAVVCEGKVVERGKHTELMSLSNGIYQSMVLTQNKSQAS